MIGDSTIADLDDGRIGLRARVRPAGGTVCPSYFRQIRIPHPPEQAIVSESSKPPSNPELDTRARTTTTLGK